MELYITGQYTVEIEDVNSKKKSQQHRHTYGKPKVARVNPEYLRRWGSGPKISSPKQQSAPSSTQPHKQSDTNDNVASSKNNDQASSRDSAAAAAASVKKKKKNKKNKNKKNGKSKGKKGKRAS